MSLIPTTIQEIQDVLRSGQRVLPRGGGTKPALSTAPPDAETLEMTGIAGMLEYEPGEFTFTALAGTRIRDINEQLAVHAQYLPFDPLLVERGATLGGCVASGVSGPGRYHYGGVRDFLLGVRFVGFDGRLVRGGGRVVKNSAGFDLPKLMVGSLGSLGVLVELAFKVFPRPEAYATLAIQCASLEEALQAMQRAAQTRLDIDALDLQVSPSEMVVWVRLGSLAKALPARLESLRTRIGEGQVWQGTVEEAIWREARELAWVPQGTALVKVPLTPGRIPAFESLLGDLAGRVSTRRYSSGGQVCWLALEGDPAMLNDPLAAHDLQGLVLFGPPGMHLLGKASGGSFNRRVKLTLDPAQHFVEV